MKLKDLHNDIKNNYESGKYDKSKQALHNTKTLSKLSNYQRAMITNTIILLLFLTAIYSSTVKGTVARYPWLYNIGLACFILNCVGFIFAASCYYHNWLKPMVVDFEGIVYRIAKWFKR